MRAALSTNIHLHVPQVVGVLGGQANPQCIQDAVGVVEGERGRWQFESHRCSLRKGKHFSVQTFCMASSGNEMFCCELKKKQKRVIRAPIRLD